MSPQPSPLLRPASRVAGRGGGPVLSGAGEGEGGPRCTPAWSRNKGLLHRLSYTSSINNGTSSLVTDGLLSK